LQHIVPQLGCGEAEGVELAGKDHYALLPRQRV
jgi:hypothetical protein